MLLSALSSKMPMREELFLFFFRFFEVAIICFNNLKEKVWRYLPNRFFISLHAESQRRKIGLADRLKSVKHAEIHFEPTRFPNFPREIYNSFWRFSSEMNIMYNPSAGSIPNIQLSWS